MICLVPQLLHCRSFRALFSRWWNKSDNTSLQTLAETFSLYDNLIGIHISGRLISHPDIISRQKTRIKHDDEPQILKQQSSLVCAFNDLPYDS